MKPVHHILISGGVTAVLSIWIKSSGALLACFLSGIFIDLDHHLDYFIAKKRIPLSYNKLSEFCHNEHGAKLYLIFHSYELLAVIWICIYGWSLGNIWVGVAVGMTTHLFCDEFANPIKPMAYFFTFRLKKNFTRELLLKKEFFDGTL